MSKENNLQDFINDLADSIREVEGTSDPINPQDFSDRVKALKGGKTLDALIDGSLTEVTSNATKVKGSVFSGCSALTTANFPNATTIDSYAFSGCHALTSVDFPNATSVEHHAFQNCIALTTANFPNATTIGQYAFSSCEALPSINLPEVTSIDDYGIRGCYALKTVNIPKATSIGYCSINNAHILTSVNMPNITSIGGSAFGGCYSLTKLIVGTNKTTVATLGSTTFFSSYHIVGKVDETYNPTGAKDGYIYVPDDLVDSYKSATNWSTYADQIKGISELPTEE